MSDSAFSTFRTISNTPMRDLVRGQFTGRLDWRLQLAQANLPAPAAELIRRVVQRTRLFRLERADLANELIAHFQDGLAAGSSAQALVDQFGDERVAAKLIGRAKRRGRALPWQILAIVVRVLAALVGIYAIFLIRFCLSQPTIAVDYVARLNEPIMRTAPDDLAWPLWRQVILESTEITKEGNRVFPEAILPKQVSPPWADTVKWLTDHPNAVALARQAAQKPVMGFVLGAAGSAEDAEVFPSMKDHPQVAKEPAIQVMLPHLNFLRGTAAMLSADAKLGAEQRDGARVEADLNAMFALARQLRNSDGFLVTQLVALGIDALAIERLDLILWKFPESLNDDQLVRLAHAISGPQVAADLMTFSGERVFFDDFLQRIYTDDGHGDGHMTLAGVRFVSAALAPNYSQGNRDEWDWEMLGLEAAGPMVAASRAELAELYNRFLEQTEADFHQPIREVNQNNMTALLAELRSTAFNRRRFAVLNAVVPGTMHSFAECERNLGNRDGAEVGIALELYHRKFGKYPATLDELTPRFLPRIPADRVTGDPVKYRLIDGKPVVYSVGADRVDDGGAAPDPRKSKRPHTVVSWGNKPEDVEHGDWLLFAPPTAEDEK